MKKPVVTIFGSSFSSEDDGDYKFAYNLGKNLAIKGYVICNGGYGGTMEATARGAHEAGGESIGIIAEIFSREPNQFLTKIMRVKTHAERLLKLIEIGDAYIVLPGITGTLLEFVCVWEYMAKSLIKRKPLIAIGDFWKPVIETVCAESIKHNSTITAELVKTARNIDNCIEILERCRKNETL